MPELNMMPARIYNKYQVSRGPTVNPLVRSLEGGQQQPPALSTD